jgi:hypothetical protein
MRKQTRSTRYDAAIAIAADDGTVLVSCTFAPHANKIPIDEVPADMVMIAKSQGVKLPHALHMVHPDHAEMVRSALLEDFSGHSGEIKLLPLKLRPSQPGLSRHLALVGLGPSHAYCDSVVCSAFETFLNQAVDQGARTVLVPFVVNNNSEFALTHKATAYRLKSIVKRVAQSRGGLGQLQEIKIYCTPAAVKSIREGLNIPHAGNTCGCATNNRQCSSGECHLPTPMPLRRPRRRGE